MRFFAFIMAVLFPLSVHAVEPSAVKPWLDRGLSPDQRASLLNVQLTTDERLTLVHGVMPLPVMMPNGELPPGVLPSAGYVPGIPRLGIPALRETDAGLGVAWVDGLQHDGATAMPSALALAASFDPALAYQQGATIGREAALKGFNVLLAGGVNLTREPRNGRNFEYLGEDPLLAGTLAGEAIRGIQDQHVISTIKHFAVNDQETGRSLLTVSAPWPALRDSDLRAFQIAIARGQPGAVMCAYNRLNGPYACENPTLLRDILKGEWGYRGWVMSDWGAVHSVEAALAGLDQESGEQLDSQVYFGEPLRAKVAISPAYADRLSDMTQRILRSMFAVGLFDEPRLPGPLDLAEGAEQAQRIAEAGMVLLKNSHHALPLSPTVKSIAVIGGHADLGVLSGGGSSQVAPPAGPALQIPQGSEAQWDISFTSAHYHPSSPWRALKAALPHAEIHYDSGDYVARAVRAAQQAEVAIVFATQWMGESRDAPDLTLPHGQDALIAAVAAANPRTIVVLETGGPVLMPWLPKVAGVIEAWYPGIRGGEAMARVLSGAVNPSGRLPMTFPASPAQLPNPALPGAGLPAAKPFTVTYPEGAAVGYQWYTQQRFKPLFAFGFGLSYGIFDYEAVARPTQDHLWVTIRNTGSQDGKTTPQVYSVEPSGQRRLLGWQTVRLHAGERQRIDIPLTQPIKGKTIVLSEAAQGRDRWWQARDQRD